MIPKHAKEILDELKKLDFKIMGKDRGLIDSVEVCISIDKKLSDKQEKWLNNIYAKATGGGMWQKRSYV